MNPDADGLAAPSEDPARLRARVSELERQVRRPPANATAFFAS